MTGTVDIIERYGTEAHALRDMLALARPELAVSRRERRVPLEGDAWVSLLAAVEDERISGLLWAAIEAGFPVTPIQRVEAAQLHHASMTVLVHLEATRAWVLGLLRRAGIDVRVIKGLATGPVVHDRPEDRDSGDIDLLVPPVNFANAIEVLEQAGIERGGSWGRDSDVFAKEVVFIHHGVEIDLHQSLAYGSRWRRATPRLMEQGIELPGQGGHEATLTLSMEALFLSACVSAAGSDARLTGWLDIATISHHPGLDLHRLGALIDAIGCISLIEPVVQTTNRAFSVEPSVLALVQSTPSGRLDRFCTGLETADGGTRFLYSCLSGHPRTWSRGLRTLARPDDAYFRAEGRQPSENWRRIFDRTSELVRRDQKLPSATN